MRMSVWCQCATKCLYIYIHAWETMWWDCKGRGFRKKIKISIQWWFMEECARRWNLKISIRCGWFWPENNDKRLHCVEDFKLKIDKPGKWNGIAHHGEWYSMVLLFIAQYIDSKLWYINSHLQFQIEAVMKCCSAAVNSIKRHFEAQQHEIIVGVTFTPFSSWSHTYAFPLMLFCSVNIRLV